MKMFLAYLKCNTESKEEIIDYYFESINLGRKTFTVTPNLDFYRITYKDNFARKCINSATISTIDGKPVFWIAKWLKNKNFKHKVSGSDLAVDLLPIMNEKSSSLFLFGGKEGVGETAKNKIKEQYPNINICGVLCPDFGFEKNEEKCRKYIEIINESKAQFVFLCTGFPKTEKFFCEHEQLFETANYLSVGATIDFIAGTIKRAPKWMTKIGLEWFFRLTKDFKRLFKRYFLDGCFLIKLWWICHFNKAKIKRIIEEDSVSQ